MKKSVEQLRPILDIQNKPAWVIGRMVHFVEPDGTDEGIHRPAFVNWDFTGKRLVLTVIHPQRIYSKDLETGIGRDPVVEDQVDKKPNSWHWPELPESPQKQDLSHADL